MDTAALFFFPAPSDATMACVKEDRKLDFCRLWRREATVRVRDVVVNPSLRCSLSYYAALRAGLPPIPVAISREDVRSDCAVRVAEGHSPHTLPDLLVAAGLR